MISAVIFDMDGLLTDSETRWRQAELEVAADIGLTMTVDDLKETTGVRMVEVAQIWYQKWPWEGPSPSEVAERVVDRVIELGETAVCLPGVEQTLDLVEQSGLRVALCSSSDKRLIDATLDQLGLTQRFEIVHSAEQDEFGKPHPMPYLKTAEALGVDPATCLAFEDSLNGCISARAASMRVVAVPDREMADPAEFGFCAAVLNSLEEMTPDMLKDFSS